MAGQQEHETSKAKAPVKTIGGQPLWVWGVAGAVMIVAAIYLYRKNAANTAANSQGSGTGTGTGTKAAAGPAQYGSTFEATIQDLQSSPQITKSCPAGYTLATSGPHAGMCVRNTASKTPIPVDKPVPGKPSPPKTPKGVAA